MKMLLFGCAILACVGSIALGFLRPQLLPDCWTSRIEDLTGRNLHPVTLHRPARHPLSTLALIGQKMFNDPALSASGRLACASCHDAEHGYSPPPGLAPTGPRAVPSLAYLYRQGPFAIGPAMQDDGPPISAPMSAGATPPVPHGGLMWDGRADTLMAQAAAPMLDPAEMANATVSDAAARMSRAGYADLLAPFFGPGIKHNPDLLFAEAMSAMARYQIEDISFHRFDSKYDAWLEGKARLNDQEMRGLRLFNDPAKGNCADCHSGQPGQDGLPPLFTDGEYKALGVPRNQTLTANRDPRFFDMGLCGPRRTDLAAITRFCGMFRTPSLRNTAKRNAYFHNGVYRSLREVLNFYNLRAVRPSAIYRHSGLDPNYFSDDLPPGYYGNIDRLDAPFNRRFGDVSPLSNEEIDAIIAFLGTLNDGWSH